VEEHNKLREAIASAEQLENHYSFRPGAYDAEMIAEAAPAAELREGRQSQEAQARMAQELMNQQLGGTEQLANFVVVD